MASMRPAPTWPTIFAAGGPGDRGRAYGSQAAERVRRSIEIYTGVFRSYAGLGWAEARERARAFVDPIDAYDPELLPEMAGIAEGSGLELEDVLALNLRTEMMFGVPHATGFTPWAGGQPRAGECTAIVALPEATADGHTLIAQNWDWKPAMRDTTVLLVEAPDQGPAFASVVEAGLVAKTGLNEAGIGLVTNTLTCDQDLAAPGVPYHALLRRILRSGSLGEAMNAILAARRSASGNFVIAHRGGEAVDLETTPGGVDHVFVSWPATEGPAAGTIVHANHFCDARFAFRDEGLIDGADSLVRQRRAERATLERPITLGGVQQALSDHFDAPNSVCTHDRPDDVQPELDYATLSSVVMDLGSGTMWISAGRPCDTPYAAFATTELFAAARGAS
jgi:isopenicillin-N N-acyltransferase-like protein